MFSSAMRVVKDWLRKGTLPATNKPNLFNEVADEALDLAVRVVSCSTIRKDH